jgi:3-phosphoshikimate 1-carboxyvinyltransferase
MKEIKTQKIANCEVSVPGSKSYTHRMLIAAALSDGICTIKNALISEDTQFTIEALKQMGVQIEVCSDDMRIYGGGGRLGACAAPIYLGNSGTSMRLLTGVAALGKGTYTLTGTDRMQMRPIKALLDALELIGVRARSLKDNDCPPVEITGATIRKDQVDINCQKSSQYLSALLLIAPCLDKGLQIRVTGGPVSRPYVDLTIDLMKTFGLHLKREGYRRFDVPGGQIYRAGEYSVEADCSQAAYFWGAAAIGGGSYRWCRYQGNGRQGRFCPGRHRLCRFAATNGVPCFQGIGRHPSLRSTTFCDRSRSGRYAGSGTDARGGGSLCQRHNGD